MSFYFILLRPLCNVSPCRDFSQKVTTHESNRIRDHTYQGVRNDNFQESFAYVLHEGSLNDRKSPSDVFFRKGVLKICSKFKGEHPCRSAISIKLKSNFIDIALWYGCSPENLLNMFRTHFHKNTSGWLKRLH